MNKQKTVLFLEWTTYGREFEINLPLMYFFENILKWNVEYKSQFNLPSVIKTKPDIVIMSGYIGAKVGLAWARDVERSGILLFTHITEGMFREKDIEEFVYGHNKVEKIFYETLTMAWSYKAYEMAIKAFPDIKKVYKVSGAVGVDKYQIFNFKKTKNKFYSKIIGYAGYDFHNILNHKEYWQTKLGKSSFHHIMNSADNTNEILKYIIRENQDILFLLKPHPGDAALEPLEFKDLLNYKNVIVLEKKISIIDAIYSSDIWLNYNSSTNLEAWLLNKPSISFLSDKDMYSSDVLYGSVIETNPKKIQNMIEEFYAKKSISRFNEKEQIREKLIRDYMGFSDGMNHVRFLSFLKPYIEDIENSEEKIIKWNIPLKRKIIGYIKNIIYTISNGKYWLPYLNKWSSFYERFNEEDIKKAKKLHYPKIDEFYKVNNKKINNIYNNYESAFNQCVE